MKISSAFPRTDRRAVGAHLRDGLAVDLERLRRVEFHRDFPSRQNLHDLFLFDVLTLEDGWEHHERLKLPRAVVDHDRQLLRLRKAVGPLIGANFDPSHLFWQGIDPVAAIRRLGDAIYFVHAKDTRLDPLNGPVNGMLDTKRFTCEQERSWLFRTVGYGHDALVWKDIVSNLRLAGYDDVLSIEHEDSLMSPREGLEKAIAFLKGILMYDSKNNDVFWA